MPKTFNNEYYIALEGKDLQANAMAVDNTGTYVLLAGRRCMAIKCLDDEKNVVQKFPRQSKYEVSCAEWNPTPSHKEFCAISSNQRLEVFTWRPSELTQSYSIKAHTRVITDINWHQFDPNLLATCSADTFIYIWDVRDPRRPSISLSAIAEASQVRCNRLSPHLMATAHDGDIKIWDQRKGTSPVQYVSAHVAKIHGLDWSHTNESQLASSSQDSTVKFFDTTNPRRAEYFLTTNAPVWRARYTPFGNGIVTVVVPQLRRGENSLLLWNTANRAVPMHTFVGHRDVVLEFQWRKHRTGDQDFELITWSKDQTLLVWKIEPFLQKLCGYEPDDETRVELDDCAPALEAVDIEIETVKLPKKNMPKVQPLQQEFSLINVQIPNLEVKKMDPINRTCNVKASITNFTVNLEVTFPNAYPHGVTPVFQVMAGSNLTDTMAIQLLQTLNHLAQQRVSKNRTCLEPCLRQMVTTLEQLSSDVEDDRIFNRSFLDTSNMGGYNDAYIPFPKTSGAKFCSVGLLVCFGRSFPTRPRLNKSEATTPRTLSALENILAKRDNMSVSAYYFQRQRSRIKPLSSKLSKTLVHIYDGLGLFFINKQLAEEYVIDGDVASVCKQNAAAARRVGRWDLVQAWKLAELMSSTVEMNEDMAWSRHPLGNQLIESLISHYALQSDIQMAAMLSCIFGRGHNGWSGRSSLKSLLSPGSGGSPYHTIPPADVMADGWVLTSLRPNRSSSLDNLKLEQIASTSSPPRNPSTSLCEYYKLAYAETLHRWGLLYKRAEIVKCMCAPTEIHKGVEFLTDCRYCVKPSKHCCCRSCKRLSFNCIICHVSVRGSANCCVMCGHGGHTNHLTQWFMLHDVCATGCGCHCLLDSQGIFVP